VQSISYSGILDELLFDRRRIILLIENNVVFDIHPFIYDAALTLINKLGALLEFRLIAGGW
jgi:hypothetical protein